MEHLLNQLDGVGYSKHNVTSSITKFSFLLKKLVASQLPSSIARTTLCRRKMIMS